VAVDHTTSVDGSSALSGFIGGDCVARLFIDVGLCRRFRTAGRMALVGVENLMRVAVLVL